MCIVGACEQLCAPGSRRPGRAAPERYGPAITAWVHRSTQLTRDGGGRAASSGGRTPTAAPQRADDADTGAGGTGALATVRSLQQDTILMSDSDRQKCEDLDKITKK